MNAPIPDSTGRGPESREVFSTAFSDQFRAANSAMRENIKRLSGIDPGKGHVSGWLSRVSGLQSPWYLSWPRCAHLSARPVQPSYAAAHERFWRCSACGPSWAGRVIDPVEESTCDGCRRYLPGVLLNGLVVRQDIFLVTCGLCDPCYRRAMRSGARTMERRAAS